MVTRPKIILPKRNEFLAEFFGILTGDGYINQYRYPDRRVSVIEITGNKEKDFDYMKEYVCFLTKNLFNLTPNFYVRESQNTIRVIIYSKEIFDFIKKENFPLGNKGEIKIPKWIIEEKLFFKRFVKGFFDTDGCLCLKNKEGKKYPSIGLSSKSQSLLIRIKSFLARIKIPSYLGKRIKKDLKLDYKLEINGSKNVLLFFKEIGSNNIRNLTKYWEFLRMGPPGVEPGTL